MTSPPFVLPDVPSHSDWYIWADWLEDERREAEARAARLVPQFLILVTVDEAWWRQWLVAPAVLRVGATHWHWIRWLPLEGHPNPGAARWAEETQPYSYPHGCRLEQWEGRRFAHPLGPLMMSPDREMAWGAIGNRLELPHVVGLGPFTADGWTLVDLGARPPIPDPRLSGR